MSKTIKSPSKTPASPKSTEASAGPDGMAVAPPDYDSEGPILVLTQPAPLQMTPGFSTGDGKSDLPDRLKTGIELLSGLSLDDVRVHYNLSKPSVLQALAYAQGTDIHVAPGQERHLPHEAWHVVQQKQGRVQPTIQMKGRIAANDDTRLEHEADVMGTKALAVPWGQKLSRGEFAPLQRTRMIAQQKLQAMANTTSPVIQRVLALDLLSAATTTVIAGEEHEEIPHDKEQGKWGEIGVNVVYEGDDLPGSGKIPDPPMLRVAYLWSFFYDPAEKFWNAVSGGEDVSDEAVTMNSHRELVQRLKGEIAEVERGGDSSLDGADDLLDALVLALPGDNNALMALSLANREIKAEAKKRILEQLQEIIYNAHWGGDFGDVDFKADDLMVERSRQMFLIANAAAPAKTIYKVGNEHVDDMKRLKLKPNPKVAILSRAEYIDEYVNLHKFRSGASNQNISDSIGDDNDLL